MDHQMFDRLIKSVLEYIQCKTKQYKTFIYLNLFKSSKNEQF